MTALLGKCDTCGNKAHPWNLGVDNKNACDCGGSIVLISAYNKLIDTHPPPVIAWDSEHRYPFFKDTTPRTYQVKIPDVYWPDFLRKVHRRKYYWGLGDDEYVSLTVHVIEIDHMDNVVQIEMEWE